jgi:glycosyltransferase involved in cell wall biosynthesis
MPAESDAMPDYSVIVPVGWRFDTPGALVREYVSALTAEKIDFELIVVLDGQRRRAATELRESGVKMRIVQLSRSFGESAALSAGFAEAKGKWILTLPAYYQVEPEELPRFLQSVIDADEMLLAVRSPRAGSAFEHFRRFIFHGIIKLVTGNRYRDLGCSVKLFHAGISNEIHLYGDQHRFLPILARQHGYRVREVDVRQSEKDEFRGRYKVREYLNGLINIITIFFLMRFTKKPLRFFGTIGAIVGGFGALLVTILVVQRLIFQISLADRPALLLASLLMVLGTQIFSLGLIGELVIFAHAGELKEYAIRRIYSADESESGQRHQSSEHLKQQP